MSDALETFQGSSILIPSDIHPRTRMVFGCGTLTHLGTLAQEILQHRSVDGVGANRVLLVSDPGVIQAGHTAKGIASLTQSGIEVGLFDGARENPTTDHVQQGVEFAKQFQPDLIVGLGGGSSMDCAKGINFIYTNEGEMKDYWGVDKAKLPMLPLICVPTTSGTGSEMQSFALISDARTHIKMACGDKKTAAKVAILDPELTLTQPTKVTSLTGIDAISHAVETYVSRKRNAISQMYSRESFRLLSQSFLQVLRSPLDLEARSAMHLGSSISGMAIENSMLGAAHALANPLTAAFGTSHGQAVGLMLPHVVRFNAFNFEQEYAELMQTFGGDGNHLPDHIRSTDLASEKLALWLTFVAQQAGLAVKLSELQIDCSESQLQELGANAAKQWTGTFNPRPVNAENLTSLYRNAV